MDTRSTERRRKARVRPRGVRPFIRWGAASVLVAAAMSAASCRTVTRLSTDPAPLQVLVWNIHLGADANGENTLVGVARLIDSTRADIALLQEVDRATRRSGGVDQVAQLAALTRMEAVFGKTLDYQGGGYGIAVLSRWPIVSDTLIRLPVEPRQPRAGGSYEPRGVLQAAIRAPRGVVHVLNTHLDPSADDSYRQQEIAHLLLTASRLRSSGDIVLLGGDFNATPESEVIATVRRSGLRDVWAECGGLRRGLTYPAAEPVKRIDYLFAPDNIRCDSAVVIASAASDHRPIVFYLGVLFPVRERAPMQYDPRVDSIRPPTRLR